MKKYLLNITTSKRKATAMQKTCYAYLSDLVGFGGADVTFAFPELEAVDELNYGYWEACDQYTSLVADGTESSINIYCYEESCDDVNVHNGYWWEEMVIDLKSIIEFSNSGEKVLEDIAREKANQLEGLERKLFEDKEGVQQAIFRTGSNQVKLVGTVKVNNRKEAAWVVKYLADKYNLLLNNKKEDIATISDFTVAEWKVLHKHFSTNHRGYVTSKKSSSFIKKEEVKAIKEWLKKHSR